MSNKESVLVIGSGPIVIGQAAEFDYSGSQGCKALRENGYHVILVNSNPATIQTDSEMADTIYMEPLTPETIQQIIEREKPDAFLGTLGGQTGLNLTTQLAEQNVFAEHNIEVLGTDVENIHLAEDRDEFGQFMNRINEPMATSIPVSTLDGALEAAQSIGFPVIIRPAYTLGGSGGGVANNENELKKIGGRGLDRSPVNQILIEQSLLGFLEFEYELMRDHKNNCIVVCNMENIDPMGIHTGESAVVAPSQTLSDREHQTLRSAAIKIIRGLNIKGGCNIQFAVDPESREYYVVEVNPRVSRSSALASKVTGYPIAKIAAKIATGQTLDKIPNDIVKNIQASFEPALDYIVVKLPRWPFNRFPEGSHHLGTEMKSTGETMAIGRTFSEALQKALRSLDTGRQGICGDGRRHESDRSVLERALENPTDRRLYYLYDALRAGMPLDEVHRRTNISPFFLHKINDLVELEERIREADHLNPNEDLVQEARQHGFDSVQLSNLNNNFSQSESSTPSYKMVDTCAGEFKAETPYFYSTWDSLDEVSNSNSRSVMILGSGPIRIGQGIEFDYCCVHASTAIAQAGYESIMVNNNPETVSTDYDISDRLYFEPLTAESVLNIVNKEDPEGVIVQFGGQTPLNIATTLEERGVNILGTSPENIRRTEDRGQFADTLERLDISQAPFGIARSVEEATSIARDIGYPVLARPSYVLGGKSMTIAHDSSSLREFLDSSVEINSDQPVLIDKFLEEATEIDVDAVSDGQNVYIGGIMEHIEQAGVHSGDSACVIPPQSLSSSNIAEIKQIVRSLAQELNVSGLINFQFAVLDNRVYLIEANPRASRTIPFVSKATGVSLVNCATRVMLGESLPQQNLPESWSMSRVAVKESVFPFKKMEDVDPILGPEMKSTGEVMGIGTNFPAAFFKAQQAAGNPLPANGTVLFSVNDRLKDAMIPVARMFDEMDFNLVATHGTARSLKNHGISAKTINKVSEGPPHIVDRMETGQYDLIINLPTTGEHAHTDGFAIRRRALELDIPYITTKPAASAAARALKQNQDHKITIHQLV